MTDTQKQLIACCLLDYDAFDSVSLSVDHFTGACRNVWAAMTDLHSQGIPLDPVVVGSACGVDPSNLMVWYDMVVTSAPGVVAQFAKGVKAEYDRRNIINLTQDALTDAKEGVDPDKIMLRLEESLYQMADNTEGCAVFARDHSKAVLRQMEEAYKRGGQLTGLRTGFELLDNATCGFQNSDLIIIASRPSVGKTSFGMNIAETISVDNQRCGLVISREMSRGSLIRRMVCSRAGVDIMKGLRGTFNQDQMPSIMQAENDIRHSPLMVDDRAINIHQIRAEARRQKRKNDIKYLMVDYLQLVPAPGKESKVAEIDYVSKQFKDCAKELNIPVIVLAQINREHEHAKGMPRLEHLKGSGAIEEDADLVILLHRDKQKEVESAKAIIAKQRNGPLSLIKLDFNGPLTRFTPGITPGITLG